MVRFAIILFRSAIDTFVDDSNSCRSLQRLLSGNTLVSCCLHNKKRMRYTITRKKFRQTQRCNGSSVIFEPGNLSWHSLRRIKTDVIGFSFISAVFLSYYILGLGLFQVLLYIANIREMLAMMGVALRLLNIVRVLKARYKSPIPEFFRNFLELKM